PAISPQTGTVSARSRRLRGRDSPTGNPSAQSRFVRSPAFAFALHGGGPSPFTREFRDGGQVVRFASLLAVARRGDATGSQRAAQAFTQRSATELCLAISMDRTILRQIARIREISIHALRTVRKSCLGDPKLEHAQQQLTPGDRI